LKILKMAGDLVLVALAVVLSAGLAKSQVVKGTFTLPVEVRWGGATLPAGDYTLRVDDISVPQLIRVEGEGKSAFILAGSHDPFAISNLSQLVLVETAHGYAVRSLEVGEVGVSIDFVVSKQSKTTQYASDRKPLGNIQVAVLGGR
jgi:hypothetical protein